jgi:hypothetical protein
MSSLLEKTPLPARATPLSAMATVATFLLTSLLTAALIGVGGWMTSLSMVFYGAGVSLLTFALLPFVLILLGIALPFLMAAIVMLSLVASVIGPLLGEPVEPVEPTAVIDGAMSGIEITSFGGRIMAPYYKWLTTTRHPALWGGVVGVVVGTGLLWGLITWHVLPGEARTVQILTVTRDAVLEQFKATKQLPPVNGGHLLYQDLGLEMAGPVVDGFGQPLEYDVQLPSFRLRSRGFDQRPGSDDFCLTGEVELNAFQKLVRWKEAAKQLMKGFDFKIEEGKLTFRGQLGLRNAAKLITALRCSD